MLTSDLLLTRSSGPYIEPRYVDAADQQFIDLAQSLIDLYAEHPGKPRSELQKRSISTRATAPTTAYSAAATSSFTTTIANFTSTARCRPRSCATRSSLQPAKTIP